MRVLIVEDEPEIAAGLCQSLEGERYEVVVEPTGEEAFFRINTETFDLILLDPTLPGRDGLEVLRAVREKGVKTPVLALIACDTDRAASLDSGADDCLVKPFSVTDVLDRVRTLFRRRGALASPLIVRDLTMDLATRRLTRGGRLVKLTLREFELLEYLMRFEGEVVSRQTLARDVWKRPERTKELDNTIDACIARLRRKVELDPASNLIHTVRGIGFVLAHVRHDT